MIFFSSSIFSLKREKSVLFKKIIKILKKYKNFVFTKKFSFFKVIQKIFYFDEIVFLNKKKHK